MHLPLTNVTVENLTWRECIQRYDRSHTVFYVDPPYYGMEGYYGKDLLRREEFENMGEVLGGVQGHFVLSLNDRPEIRWLFRAFPMIEVGMSYSVSRKMSGRRPVTELLISNAPFPGS